MVFLLRGLSQIQKQKRLLKPGLPGSRMTGGDTDHYTKRGLKSFIKNTNYNISDTDPKHIKLWYNDHKCMVVYDSSTI